ncbi:MAG: ComEA family DNA-binding protein [Candidatus Eremiobacteraeota bacterium]|nr:ComEA family DNA-binding protein [Candidatus Eremiobacteraeota bacterium]
MKSWLLIPVAAVIAALAIWHPAPRPAVALTAIPASPRPHRVTLPRSVASVVVYVVGAVKHPGVFHLPAGSRGQDAIARADGFASGADPSGVNLAEPLTDGEQVTAPLIGQATPRPSRAHGRVAARRRKSSAAPVTQTIDLNTADTQTLSELPGVGATLADRIVRYRELNGAFANLDELADVAGMTDRRIQQISPYVSIR